MELQPGEHRAARRTTGSHAVIGIRDTRAVNGRADAPAMTALTYRLLINRDLPIRDRACESKAVYLTRGEARQQLRGGRHMDGAMKPYHCRFCGRWHLGHRRRSGRAA